MAEIGLLPVGILTAVGSSRARIPVGFRREKQIIFPLETVPLIYLEHPVCPLLQQNLVGNIEVAKVLIDRSRIFQFKADRITSCQFTSEIDLQDLMVTFEIQWLVTFGHLTHHQCRIQTEGKFSSPVQCNSPYLHFRRDLPWMLYQVDIVSVYHHSGISYIPVVHLSIELPPVCRIQDTLHMIERGPYSSGEKEKRNPEPAIFSLR